MKSAIIEKLEEGHLKKDIPDFRIGDTISVHVKIVEVSGDDKKKASSKERVQVFTGTVIARKGSGLSETVSLHRVAYGEGMERVFLLHSPRIVKIELKKRGKVRRSKLYYIRGKQGKKAKIQGDIYNQKKTTAVEAEPAPAPAVEEAKPEEQPEATKE